MNTQDPRYAFLAPVSILGAAIGIYKIYRWCTVDNPEPTKSTTQTPPCYFEYLEGFSWENSPIPQSHLRSWLMLGDEFGDRLFEKFKGNPKNCRFDLTVPDWVDWEQIERGQAFMTKNRFLISQLLGVTLVGGLACPEINEVLISNRYIIGDVDDVKRRLLETGYFLRSLRTKSLLPFEDGFMEILKIRFYHSRVRKKLKSEHWDLEKFGVPINQLHLAATLLGFQLNVLAGMQKAFGIEVSQNDREDYTAFWRYVGFVLGIREEINPCTSFAETEIRGQILYSYLFDKVDPRMTSLVTLMEKALNKIVPGYGYYNRSLTASMIGPGFETYYNREQSLVSKVGSFFWRIAVTIFMKLNFIRKQMLPFFERKNLCV